MTVFIGMTCFYFHLIRNFRQLDFEIFVMKFPSEVPRLKLSDDGAVLFVVVRPEVGTFLGGAFYNPAIHTFSGVENGFHKIRIEKR